MGIATSLSLTSLSKSSLQLMAAKPFSAEEEEDKSPQSPPFPLSSYIGLSFAVFLSFLPKSSVAYLSSLQSRNRILSLKLFQAEDQLRGLRSRRKEDSKANARVVEIFASHRNAWQQEEKRLLQQIEASREENERLRARIGELERSEAELRASVERLEREVVERDEMIDFMGRRSDEEGEEEKEVVDDEGQFGDLDRDRGIEDEMAAAAAFYAEKGGFGSGRDFYGPMAVVDSKRYLERSREWQDMQYDSNIESMFHMKNFVTRRESPWNVQGNSAITSKLKLLEEELINLEKVGKGDLSKVSSLMRKQAKRYQSLTAKIDDLCRRMQASDPCEPTLSPEFRAQQQNEFLLEVVRLQHRATETRQKLHSLQAETTKSYTGDDLSGQTKLSTRRALETIGNNLKEIQRNLEIWLARICGDVEGILSRERDAASRVRDYYLSRNPFVR